MLCAMADLTEEQGDRLTFTRNGQTLTVHSPKRKEFSDIQGLMQIRHFLERSAAPPQAPLAGGTRAADEKNGASNDS